MRLDRNLNVDGGGKYALLKLRVMRASMNPDIYAALKVLEGAGILDWGNTVDSEFMVIRLKDIGARAALQSYAHVFRGMAADHEYAAEIEEMAARSGPSHPNCKKPD